MAYLRAICSQACFSFARWEEDYNKTDVVIQRIGFNIPISLQLKSTTEKEVPKENLSIRIDTKTYNILRKEDTYRRFLVVLILPNSLDWVEVSDDQLLIRKCMYWADLRGFPPVQTKTVAVPININQVASPEWLCSVVEGMAEECV